MSEQSAEGRAIEVEGAIEESPRVRPVMRAGKELVGYQCLTCKGERVTFRPGIGGAMEQVRCEPCGGFGYVPRSE